MAMVCNKQELENLSALVYVSSLANTDIKHVWHHPYKTHAQTHMYAQQTLFRLFLSDSVQAKEITTVIRKIIYIMVVIQKHI